MINNEDIECDYDAEEHWKYDEYEGRTYNKCYQEYDGFDFGEFVHSLIISGIVLDADLNLKSPLQENVELIVGCVKRMPDQLYFRDWLHVFGEVQLSGKTLAGIGACIGPNDVEFAVEEALNNPFMNKQQFRTCHHIDVCIYSGYELLYNTTKSISGLVSAASGHNRSIDVTVMLYHELLDKIVVVIIATPMENALALNDGEQLPI